jgi:hypothetical protein
VAGLTQAFSATATCGAGTGRAAVDGVFGATEWACAQKLPFMAKVPGGTVPAEVYWMNDAGDLYLAVRVQQPLARTWWSWFRGEGDWDWNEKVSSVRFEFDNDGDGIAELNDDIIGFDARLQLFFDAHLPSRCLNRRQSECFDPDWNWNGRGRADNAGTWTTYELSHPLRSRDPKDFAKSAGDRLGFFLTLQVGNGAQGNTQVPGFRIYQPITITGS